MLISSSDDNKRCSFSVDLTNSMGGDGKITAGGCSGCCGGSSVCALICVSVGGGDNSASVDITDCSSNGMCFRDVVGCFSKCLLIFH